MSKKIIILAAFFLNSIFCFSNEILVKAESSYDAKKYTEAINIYQKFVNDGYQSLPLFYNLGNAYYKNNQLGNAIYYYELARKINPNDEDVRINLGIASAKTIDKIDAKENFFISAVKTNVLSSFSTRTWAVFSIITLLMACVLFFVFVHSWVSFIKRVSFLLSCVLLVGFIVSYFLGVSALKAKHANSFAIVITPEIKIMNEPTVNGKSKFALHEGTKVKLVEKNADWALIKLDNGNEGWVKLSEIGVI
jgi:tetratricopeptide (TPR) repeat protein